MIGKQNNNNNRRIFTTMLILDMVRLRLLQSVNLKCAESRRDGTEAALRWKINNSISEAFSCI